MAFHGISSCYEQSEAWFGGIICTDGAGSSRAGPYANYSDAQLVACRREEQIRAADLGQYSFVELLNHPSPTLKDSTQNKTLLHQLEDRLLKTQPEICYTHNPADKHPTHIAVCRATVDACRRLPPHARPRKLYACEVWRDLDWLNDDEKIALDASAYPDLAEKLYACFDSQIAGGKNYPQAVMGRQKAHATFLQPNHPDAAKRLALALDLSPLLQDDSLNLQDYLNDAIERFKSAVLKELD
jgi:LmbE family N-acetylglucosaminyl deacetylase